MKRFFVILLLAILSYSNAVAEEKKRTFSHLEKESTKKNSKKKLPPTELMKLGAGYKKKAGLDSDNVDEEWNISEDEEIANKYISEDGSYVGEYKVGKEYEVFGVKYTPQKYDDFEEVGTASWYGDDFQGKKTANGEIYHKGDMTAAHPTLPLPSMVKVTNLDNGKSSIVRVNDRGPFAKNRIIDVSEKAADELGFKGKGTTTVKIEFLPEETEDMLTKLKLKNNYP